MNFDRKNRMSIFGALKPDEGQTVSRAVVTTYSLDLVALLGLVLALGGDAEAEFENSPMGLVQAFDHMRGRLQVLHQVGRIVAPRVQRSILPLLDTMVMAVAANERRQSWHPKIALIRYEGEAVQWRFWIGSRNLTGSTDLDAGLLLVSSRAKGAKPVPDIAALARDLLKDSHLTANDLTELSSARWLAPRGVTVRSLLWRQPGEVKRFLEKPLLARGERASAVGPFVDRTGLEEVTKAGCSQVRLLTTDLAAADYSPVTGIEFRTASAPEPAAEVSLEQQQDDKVAEFTEQPASGVHAKLLAVTKGERTAMLLGSANLTERGLKGPNAEAVGILDIADPALAETFHKLVECGFPPSQSVADEEAVELERAQRHLDNQVSDLLETEFGLVYDGDGLVLKIAEGAGDALAAARFEAAPFLHPEAWVLLDSGVRAVRLSRGPVAPSEQTSLVAFRATSLSEPIVKRSWLLSLQVEGLDEERRDRALLARYVGAARFRDWLRSLLDNVDGTAGSRWTEERASGGRADGAGLPAMFTLETMLSAWAREPEAFERRIGGMMAMLESFHEAFEALEDEDERTAALADLEEVRPFLQSVHDAMFADS